jgi:hypothetical protein
MQKIKSNPVKTMLTISIGFLVIFIITKLNWALLIALVIGLIGLFSSFLSKQIEFLWTKLAWFLGLIVPNILLSAIFYLFLFPIAVLSKIFGKNDSFKLKNNADSVFISSNKEFNKNSFEKPW